MASVNFQVSNITGKMSWILDKMYVPTLNLTNFLVLMHLCVEVNFKSNVHQSLSVIFHSSKPKKKKKISVILAKQLDKAYMHMTQVNNC